jgi:hypothetical protein
LIWALTVPERKENGDKVKEICCASNDACNTWELLVEGK